MEKILIIQMCRMGDLVQTLPLLKRLKEEKPGCEITVLCIRESMELIQKSPLVDCFISIPQRFYDNTRGKIENDPAEVDSLWDFPALHTHYDLVINLTHDLSSAILCEKVSGRTKFGRIQTANGEIRALGDWAKYLFAAVKNRTQNLFNLVDIHIGMGDVVHKPVEDWLPVDQNALEKGIETLKGHGYQEKGPLVALQMGANQLHRAWPTHNFAALARHLTKLSGAEIVLLGSSKEGELGAEFQRQVDFPPINLIGQTHVTELPAILRACDFLISNDTGTAHIAAAVGTRVLGLYFSTAYWGETAPYGANNIILQVELPCSPCLYSQMCETVDCKQYLTVEAVRDAALMMLYGRTDRGFDHPHLSLYHSRFLANGTLAYLPLSTEISDSYQTGFINRALWEGTLGLVHDQDYIYRCLSRMGHLGQFRLKVAACHQECCYFKDQYHIALRLVHNIICECYQEPLSQQRILTLNDELMSIQENISKLQLSLMQCYHMYQFMDIDYAAFPQINHQLVRKYSKLFGITNQHISVLGGLLSIIGESASESAYTETTKSHIKHLQHQEAGIVASEPSIHKNLHMLEMMDLGSDTRSGLFQQLIPKYSGLAGLTVSSLTALEALREGQDLWRSQSTMKTCSAVIPAEAGIQKGSLDTGLRRYDEWCFNKEDFGGTEAHGNHAEVLYLGLSSGENFGWGICGDYLTKELSRRVRTIPLGANGELRNNREIPGRVFHTLTATDLSTIYPARGTHNFGYTFFENELMPQSLRNARDYQLVFAGSTWCKERLWDAGIKHIDVLIQGVDQEIFYPITAEKGQDRFVIFSGGKFELRKGQDLVLHAIKILQAKYPDIVLMNVWYNKWPQTMEMMNRSSHIRFQLRGSSWLEIMDHLYLINGIDPGRIITYPIVSNHQLRSLYELTDLGLFPNRCEGGTNLVLMEYMACAKPVVATCTSGHKDILTENNSLMLTHLRRFELHDKEKRLVAAWEEPSLDELLAAIEYAYHHRDKIKAIGRQAGEDLKRFTWEGAAAKAFAAIFR
jgi:ADP-heptose:LPS heptosyltransferase/glycosyltransferase involved in cell wall biosynthesis